MNWRKTYAKYINHCQWRINSVNCDISKLKKKKNFLRLCLPWMTLLETPPGYIIQRRTSGTSTIDVCNLNEIRCICERFGTVNSYAIPIMSTAALDAISEIYIIYGTRLWVIGFIFIFPTDSRYAGSRSKFLWKRFRLSRIVMISFSGKLSMRDSAYDTTYTSRMCVLVVAQEN